MGAQFGGSVEACAAREYETVRPVLDLPGVDATVDDALAIVAFVGDADCETIRRYVLAFDIPPALLLTGTLDDGAACVHPYQCRSGACSRRFDEACGVCATPLAAGATCANDAQCGSAAACIADTCTRFGERGADCDDAHPCFPHDACIAGTCAVATARDAACASLVGECDLQGAALVCDLGSLTCQPVEWVPAGADCGVRDGHNLVCESSECLPSPLFGTCVAHAADGAACDPDAGPPCAFHAACIDGACRPYFSATCPPEP
ncbi:MAG: hypothetical protein U1F43_26130 [Myxococcota bacterium]